MSDTTKCFLCKEACSTTDIVSQLKWNGLKAKSEKWHGLDKFGDVLELTDWTDYPFNYKMHNSCYISISSVDHLKRAVDRKRLTQQLSSDVTPGASSSNIQLSDTVQEDQQSYLPSKRLRSSFDGPLQDKSKCVWFSKGEDKKQPSVKGGQLYRINTSSAWRSFKHHITFVEDIELKNRLTHLILLTSDLFASDITYHPDCWK